LPEWIFTVHNLVLPSTTTTRTLQTRVKLKSKPINIIIHGAHFEKKSFMLELRAKREEFGGFLWEIDSW
jgi:hypothetical protein